MAAAIGFTLGLSIMQLMPVPSAVPPQFVTSINADACVIQAPTNQGCIFYNNVELKCNGTSTPISIGGLIAGDSIVGIAIVQNLIEVIGTGINNIIGISRDNGFSNTTHAVVIHNTLTGSKESRGNFFYDESTGTTRRMHKLHRMRGNIHVQVNTKGDVHVAVGQVNPTEAPFRTGHFSYMNGTGVADEWIMYCSADGAVVGSSFSQMHPGLRDRCGAGALIVAEVGVASCFPDLVPPVSLNLFDHFPASHRSLRVCVSYTQSAQGLQ